MDIYDLIFDLAQKVGNYSINLVKVDKVSCTTISLRTIDSHNQLEYLTKSTTLAAISLNSMELSCQLFPIGNQHISMSTASNFSLIFLFRDHQSK